MGQRSMKSLFIGFLAVWICVACSNTDNQLPDNDHQNEDEPSLVEKATFIATVEEVNSGLLVATRENEEEARSSDLISVGTRDAKLLDEKENEIGLADFKKGMTVEIVYDGIIMESYPAQINSFQVKIIEGE